MTFLEAPSFFQSLSPAEVERMVGSLERRHFAAGTQVLAEGERPAQMYVITHGECGVLVKNHDGLDLTIGQVGPGATIGEMALFAGQAEAANLAPATLLALTDVDAVALDPPGFYALAAAFPQLLHNIGAILSHRLTSSYQHTVRAEHGRVTVLLDEGGPPLLAYALASSMAWHSGSSAVLVVVGATGSGDLEALAARGRDGEAGARLVLAPPTDGFAPAALAGTIEDLSHDYRHVVLLVTGQREPAPTWPDARTLRLMDGGSAPLTGPTDPARYTLRGWVQQAGRPRPDAARVLDVPPLEPPDEAALREGLLPNSTPAGRALGWMARDLCGLKVGLALGAGSVRGYAHYGVLRAFERIGLQADYVTGTSIGAIIASTYALGQSADEAARTMEETSARAFRITVPFHSLLSNAGVAANFHQVGGDTRIEELDVPLALVAADLTTGREVVLRRGLLRVAALASMAIPGIYPPVRIGEYSLVDGGLVNPVPISVATSMGADVVIAVSLGRPAAQPVLDVEAVEDRGRLPSLVHTITRSVEIMQGRIGAHSADAAAVLIQVDATSIPSVGLQSFHRGRPYIAPGEAAAEAALPDIAACLPWLRPRS
jgi:NTE family protein